jgi:hypothetical protein
MGRLISTCGTRNKLLTTKIVLFLSESPQQGLQQRHRYRRGGRLYRQHPVPCAQPEDGERTGRADLSEHGHDGSGAGWDAGQYSHGDTVQECPVPLRISSQQTGRCGLWAPSRNGFQRRTTGSSHSCSLGTAYRLFPPLGFPGQEKRRLPNRQAAIFCDVLVLRCTPSLYCASAYTAGSNSAPLSLRHVDSAT